MRIAFTRRGPVPRQIINRSLQILVKKRNLPVYHNSVYPVELFPKSSLYVSINVNTFGQALKLKERGFLLFDVKMFEKNYTQALPLIDCTDNIYSKLDYHQLVTLTNKHLIDKAVFEMTEFLTRPSQWKFKPLDLPKYRHWVTMENKWDIPLC